MADQLAMQRSELDPDLENLAQKCCVPSSADSLLIHWIESQDFSDVVVVIDGALEIVRSTRQRFAPEL